MDCRYRPQALVAGAVLLTVVLLAGCEGGLGENDTSGWLEEWELVQLAQSVAMAEEYIRKYERVPAAELAVAGARDLLRALTQDWTNGIGMEFVWIPQGVFVMGSPEHEEGGQSNEGQHEVRISQCFWMGKYEVTQGEWMAVMRENPSRFEKCGSRCPVEEVSWEDVQEFIRKLNGQESGRGYRYRLPTEAEWEYAARAGSTAATPGGDLRILGKMNAPVLDGQAWYGGNSGVSYGGGYACSGWEEKQYESERCGTHPVGQKRANGWGLHDMLGNVWEWTADRYGEYPSGLVTDPRGPSTGSRRVDRGGGWYDSAGSVRSANRSASSPGFRDGGIGFRLVRTE